MLATLVHPERQRAGARARRPKPDTSPPDPDTSPPDPDTSPPDPSAARHRRRRHNATERSRVQELNEVFERLRKACDLPVGVTKKDVINHACSIITLSRLDVHPDMDAAHMFDALI